MRCSRIAGLIKAAVFGCMLRWASGASLDGGSSGLSLAPVWCGGGSNNAWSTADNWTGKLEPEIDAVLTFAGVIRTSPSNTIASGTRFASISFSSNAAPFLLTGNAITLTTTIENDSGAPQTIALPIALNAGSTVFLRTPLGSGDLLLSGVISGDGNLEKQVQAGNVTSAILSGPNTYSGTTRILGGNLCITSIKNMGSGSPSSVGMPDPGNGTVALGTAARLIYMGTGDQTDRPIDLAGSPCRIVQSGSGLLKFTHGVNASVSGAKQLWLDGSGSGIGEMAGAITNPPGSGVTRVYKEGTGLWILSGSNAYGGATSIDGGTLALVGGGSIAGSSTIDVATGAVFDVTGVAGGGSIGASQTLKGGGTVNGSLAVAGTVDPGSGAALATLDIHGHLSFQMGSTNRVDISGAAQDALCVTGNVDLGEAVLMVTGTPTNDDYVILRSGGTLSGRFKGLGNTARVGSTGYAVYYERSVRPAQVILRKLRPAAKYVVHISVDGMHADAPRTLVAKGVGPNFKRLFDEGACTEQARTDYSSTVTSPNHASIFTGRPVFDWPGKPGHLWGNNDTHPWDQWGLTLHDPHTVGNSYGPGPTPMFTNAFLYSTAPGKTGFAYVSSIMDVVHDSGGRVGLFYSKDRLRVEEQSYDGTHGRLAPALGSNDTAVSKVDYSEYTSPFVVVSNWAVHTMADPYQYSFLHFSLPDDRGHAYSWNLTNVWNSSQGVFTDAWNAVKGKYVNASYMGAIQQVDDYLGEVFAMVETNSELAGKTAIIVTADHGGLLGGFDHGFIEQPDCFRVDVFAWGPGVSPGADLYALNPQFTYPGSTNRPDYTSAQQPIRNGDTGNLVLSLLGLGPIPGSSMNYDQSLGVIDTDGDGLSDNYERSVSLTDALSADTDGDGLSDGDESMAGTDPADRDSVLAIAGLVPQPTWSQAIVKWSGVTNRRYIVWGSTNLVMGFSVLSSNIPAGPMLTAYTNQTGAAPQTYYRISVQP